ncbi:MAG: hypothetical protein JWN23_433 [Rhodocyclales bacterium]|nr:hypothetical protein [Rhodocyclales bacterium]
MWSELAQRINFEYRRIGRYSLATLLIKVTKHALSAALWLFLMPFSVVLHCAGFRRVTVFCDRIGHLALEPDCLLKAQRLGLLPQRRYFVLAPPSRVANPHLLNYWRPMIRAYEHPLSCFVLGSMSRWILMRHDISEYLLAPAAQTAYSIQSAWGNRPPLLSLSAEDIAWSEAALRRIGLPLGSWFICLHVREGGFSPVDEALHAHRNGSISATLPAISEITRRGGWVVRIGDPTMQPMIDIPGLIDYAHHVDKSPRLDVVLCARARFILGNTSGVALVGSVFGVPCAIANAIPISTLWFREHDISIPKLLYSNAVGRYLRLDEILNSAIANYRYSALYQAAGLRVEENSAEDIRELVVEMLERLTGSFNESAEDRELSRRLLKLFDRQHYGFGSSARTGTLFLRRHADLLP